MPADLTRNRLLIPRVCSDRDLLRAFAGGAEPSALAELARRHAGLAYRVAAEVCPSAADDVAQATLILLGRKAASIADRESAAGWVFETARRLALKARTSASRRATHEARSRAPASPGDPLDALTLRELRAILAEELTRLPDDLRVPLVLCYWEGETQEAAAARLSCSVSTLKRRLDAGRDRLASRLTRRGFTGPALLTALTASQASGRVVPPAWVATVGEEPASASVAELLRPVGAAALVGKMTVVAAVLVVGLAFAGGGPTPLPAQQKPKVAAASEVLGDRLGDPLPPGAVARLGSNRFHHGEDLKRVFVSGDGKHVLSQGRYTWNHWKPNGMPIEVTGGKYNWKLWDAATGKALPLAGGKHDPKAVLTGGPAGRGLAIVAQTDKGWVLADAVTGVTLLDMPGLHHRQADIDKPGVYPWIPEIRPDGKAVAFGYGIPNPKLMTWMRGVNIWEVGKANPTELAGFPDAHVQQLLYSPDSRRLAIQFFPGDGAQIWEPATGMMVLHAPDAGRSLGQLIAFSADGRQFVKGEQGNKTVRFWNLDTGAELAPLAEEIKPYCTALSFSPDGKTIVTSLNEPRVFRFWDAATRKLVREVPARGGYPADVAWMPDGKRLITAEGDDLIVRDAGTGEVAADHQWHWYGLLYLNWSADGKLVTNSEYTDTKVQGWNPVTGQPVKIPPRSAAIPAEARYRVDNPAYSVIADEEGVVRVWDNGTGQERMRVETKDAPVTNPALSRDGKRLAVAGRTAIHVWDVGRAKAVATLPHPFSGRASTRLSADGRRVTAEGGLANATEVTRELTMVVWELPSGKLLRRFSLGMTCSQDLSADGRLLLTGRYQVGQEENGQVELWNLDIGGEPRVMATQVSDNPDAKRVLFARFAPDNRSVAIAFNSPEVLVVETATGGKRFVFDSNTPYTGYGVAFSPDGKRLATAAGRSTLIWDVSGEGRGGPPASAEAAWADLKESDAAKGFAAICYLVSRKDDAVKLIASRVTPIGRITPDRIAGLIAQLGDNEFAKREAAEHLLGGVVDVARTPLRQALAETASPEIRRRLEAVLAREDAGKPLTGERLRAARSMEVLETIGTPAARKVLATLASGAPDAELTRDAAASLGRLTVGR